LTPSSTIWPNRVFSFSCLSTPQLSSSLRSKILKPNLYHDTKQGATEYQTAKECLFKAFLKAGLGAWVEKPIEQDQFSLTV
ncbi:RED1 editase, partial [Cettia cetti]|nr:RED1 editase [Cettia cetti]